ncbi:FCD domain-containing protein [Streptomyces sp. NPDC002853]
MRRARRELLQVVRDQDGREFGVRRAQGVQAFEEAFAAIALHATVVAAARNPVLTDFFAEFAPVLREGLINLLDLIDVRTEETNHGDAAHAALVRAVEARDAEEAARVAQAELQDTLGRLLSRH